jgi:o-succinylbenzoate synthase
VPANLYKVDLPLRAPLETGAGPISVRTVWVLEIVDSAGRRGLGEAAPLPGFGGEGQKECDAALHQAVAMLTPDLVGNWLGRAKPDAPLGPLEPLLAKTPCARHAVEGALLDLLSQGQNVPLAGLIAAHYATLIPVNALIGASEDAAAAGKKAWDAGYGTLKLKVGADPREAAVRALSLRKAVGDKAAIRVDANGAWTLDQAVAFAETAAPAALEYCEQPLPAADVADLAALRRRSGIKVAADESVRRAVDVGRIGAAQAADVVVLKPMFLGGWRPLKQAVQAAHSCGMDAVITTALDSAIGRAFATRYAAAFGLTTRAQGLATGDLFVGEVTTEPLTVQTGHTRLHERPGLGIGTLAG